MFQVYEFYLLIKGPERHVKKKLSFSVLIDFFGFLFLT